MEAACQKPYAQSLLVCGVSAWRTTWQPAASPALGRAGFVAQSDSEARSPEVDDGYSRTAMTPWKLPGTVQIATTRALLGNSAAVMLAAVFPRHDVRLSARTAKVSAEWLDRAATRYDIERARLLSGNYVPSDFSWVSPNHAMPVSGAGRGQFISRTL
jgi:hypothetical protein